MFFFPVASFPLLPGLGAPGWRHRGGRPHLALCGRPRLCAGGGHQPQPIYGVKRVRVEAGEEGRNGGSLVIYGDLMELIADLELIYHS